MESDIVISGSGFYVPEECITNKELADSYNKYAESFNKKNQDKINSGLITKMELSKENFIEMASGIKKRHVINKSGILDANIMHPVIDQKNFDDLSLQATMAINAAKEAIKDADKSYNDIDGVIVACSNMQRAYPAIAIEVQNALGINGWAYDMNAACSSASFGINAAVGAIKSGLANSVLVITPEMYTGHLNFKDRKSHFIFGDGASAVVVENQDECNSKNAYKIISGKLQSKFSNRIRNDFGFLNRCQAEIADESKYLFTQNGKKVRAEVVPFAAKHILEHLHSLNIDPVHAQRLWLHQSNINMNKNIAKLVIGREPEFSEIPYVLDQYGNTGASSVIITFNKYNEDLISGDIGVLCSFGAGYTVGSVILQKL